MSKSNYSRGSSSVDDWLDGQYEYMVPDKDFNNPYVPRDAAKDITPEHSDASPPRSKEGRPSKHHSSVKDRYRPVTPPEEDDLDKERDRHRHKGRSTRSHDGDRDSRRSHHERDTKYPPKSDRGRPRRPAMSNRATSHYVPRKEDSPERRPHRRYSLSSSPPRRRGDKSSRHYHRHHEDRSPSPPPRSSRKKDDRERESRGHHHSSSGSTKGSKSSRPSLSRSQTSKEPKKPSIGSRSFSFLDDPRFKTAAQAAMTAGASAAVGLAGQKGGWGGDKGAKVLRAGLGAAALSALKSPAPSPDPAPAPAAPAPVEPKAEAAGAAGKFVAEHMPSRKKGTRRRHH